MNDYNQAYAELMDSYAKKAMESYRETYGESGPDIESEYAKVWMDAHFKASMAFEILELRGEVEFLNQKCDILKASAENWKASYALHLGHDPKTARL